MDPLDPGGSAPGVGANVTIASESGMETDGSSKGSVKRPVKRSLHKICKHCNKKKRLHPYEGKKSGCGCVDEPTPVNVANENTPALVAPPVVAIPSQARVPTQIARTQYEPTDNLPFIIHVQKIQSSPDDNTVLHPVAFGKFLKKHDFKNIINGSVKRIGRNRLALSFSTHIDANNFLNCNSLETFNFKAFIPSFSITRMGIIRGVPSEWSEDEIQECVNVPVGCGKILKVRRLNYKVMVDGSPVWRPSQTVVLTFDGQILPKRVFVCYNALSVELYTYPTIQCFQCCRFGHTKIQCRSKPRCYRCGQDHTGDSCTIEDGKCCLCSGSHYATSKHCPEFYRQKQIKISMAENCVSYAEASKLHPPVTRSYSEVLSSSKLPSVTEENVLRHPNSSAFKKTIFLKPRSPPRPSNQFGYDQSAHNNIIKDPQMISQNGCALINKNNDEPKSSTLNLILELIKVLCSTEKIPSNDAQKMFENIYQIIKNGQHSGSDNSVELP